MATPKDTQPAASSGLLSKVAKFVRNPTTNWSDLDKQDTESDNGYSKQALKAMIERKRQNDFIRKREFDQLRKLRNRGPGATLDMVSRPSSFLSSMASNPAGERASTIKKIDEIEAQMSNQWWQGRTDTPKPAGAGQAEAAPSAPSQGPTSEQTAAAKALPTVPGSLPLAPPTTVPGSDLLSVPPTNAPTSDISYAPTRMVSLPPGPGEPTEFPATELASVLDRQAPADAGLASPADAPVVPMPLEELLGDPDVEEAAIRFANGDTAGAENALMEAALGADKPRALVEFWSAALFDLYRATGQQERFDRVAIDFAERFGRSAPAWFSMPEALGLPNAAQASGQAAALSAGPAPWIAPAQLDRAGVDALQLALANAPAPWVLDWGALLAITPDAMEPLAALFAQWAAQPVQLRFRQARAFERVLRAATPAGNRSIGPAPWRLRLDALRVMGMPDDFELVALEYCITFEVSPPAWQDVRCAFRRDDPVAVEAGPIVAGPASTYEDADTQPEPLDSQGHTLPMKYDTRPSAVVELGGEILGEATEALAQLEQVRQGGDRLVVSCAKLIRVDFSAAGSILNWVASRQAEGCQVQFRDLHRLVAAFFHVIGIQEHARVALRTN